MNTLPLPRPRSLARFLCLAAALPLSFSTPAHAASEPSLVNGQKKSYGYSWQQELQLGAESDKEISESMGVYNDPKVQAYVEAVGQRVLQMSHFNDPKAPEIYRNTKFTFRVIDSPVVNAFALPGGFVYVTRGLLAHVQNEAQLAVVLGHEIAHVAARHSSQQARRSQWTQLGVIAGSILGQKVLGERGGNIAPALINAGGQAAELFLLRYSRDAEHESDDLGVNYATRAGYAAGDSARFFQSLQRLSANEGKALPTWQSTHPDPGDRAQRVVQIASATPAEQRTNVGEEQFLKHIEGLIVGEDPRGGFARNGVFYHPGLQFQMPVAAGWKLDNQHAAVVMAEPGGKALMGLKIAAGARARDAAMQFAQKSKVQILTSGDTAVNGLPTTVIIGQAETQEGNVGVWNAFIEYQGKVFSLLGYAPQQAFEQMRPTFESVAAGFSPLRDASVANVQPARLKLVRADRAAPFASFVPTSLPPDVTADHLAIMNQVSLNDSVPEGRMLKIPDVPPQPAATPSPLAGPEYRQAPAAPAYPNQTQTYPQAQPAYPGQQYPAQQYPNPQYPQTTTGTYPQQQPYPPQGYPPNAQPAPNYPPASDYPAAPPASYPAQTGNYPQQQPGSGYPSANPYPNPYPQQPSTSPYPPQTPASTYPPNSNPQGNYPQFPQPPSSSNRQPQQVPPSQPQQQPQQPNWPRR